MSHIHSDEFLVAQLAEAESDGNEDWARKCRALLSVPVGARDLVSGMAQVSSTDEELRMGRVVSRRFVPERYLPALEDAARAWLERNAVTAGTS
jgi:hypothetical protein